MNERRTSLIETALHRVEDHIEEWRKEDATLKREAEENREKLLSEAVERERKLTEELKETRRSSPKNGDIRPRVAFVIYSDNFASTLENFSPDRERLVKVVPARQSGGGMGVGGAWLVFETVRD